MKLKALPVELVVVPNREPPAGVAAAVVELPKREVPVDAAVFPNRDLVPVEAAVFPNKDLVPVVDPVPKTEPVVEAGVPNELLNIAVLSNKDKKSLNQTDRAWSIK